jgi:hypothetical protein
MKRTVIALFAVVVASSLALGVVARAASDDDAQINALYRQFTTAFTLARTAIAPIGRNFSPT